MRGLAPLLALAWLTFLLAGCQIPVPATPPEGSIPAQAPEAPETSPAPEGSPIAVARTVESRPIEGRNPINTRSWSTDFTKRTIELSEIISGGPPKDGIPSLDAPRFETIAEAGDWLTDTDPVIVYEHGGVARAYPLAVLIWHEIVNDEIAGRPVTVTFCPLCNASVVFDRRVGDMVLDFGTTGSLRHSDLVMYDRQTETWWQQFTGAALIGELASTQLTFLPSQVLGFGRFRDLFPEGEVLQRPLDRFSRSYGMNPYVDYDTYGNGLSRNGNLLLFTGEPDPRLEPLDRVVGILFPDHSSVAIPFDLVRERTVVQYDPPNGEPGIVVFFETGMSSSLSEADIGTARDIGSVGVFGRDLNGQRLEFEVSDDGAVRDAQTGSTWNIRGTATAGELRGSTLQPRVAFDHFWFAWAEFLPETELVAAD